MKKSTVENFRFNAEKLFRVLPQILDVEQRFSFLKRRLFCFGLCFFADCQLFHPVCKIDCFQRKFGFPFVPVAAVPLNNNGRGAGIPYPRLDPADPQAVSRVFTRPVNERDDVPRFPYGVCNALGMIVGLL